MRNRPVALFILIALLTLVCAGVLAYAEEKPGAKVRVFASILPVAYFVERVGGPDVSVNVLVGPGQDPHSFEPTPKLMAKLAEAKVLFKVGFPFEETLIKKAQSAFKNLQVVDLQQGIKLRAVTEEEEEHEAHESGEESGHAHEPGEMDPHTWLDPKLAKIQAKTVADTLIQIDPARRLNYENNLKAFQADLDSVNDQLSKALAPVKGKSFFVFHPAYGYLGDAYGLKQVAVQVGGKEPTARQLAELIEKAKKEGVRVIFVQPQFSRKSAETLAKEIGGAVVSLDDLAPNYIENLKEMATRLESALKTQQK
jgi:zinc transport system substrate-binding protein